TAGPAFVMGKGASQDVKASYAVGAWYGDSVPQETEKFRSVGMELDVRAFTQGFHDKIHNRLQLAQDAIAAELARIDQSLGKAMLSKNQKESAGLLEKAAKEKGAVKTSEGAVYRVIDAGKPPTAHARSQVLFELTEALGTGEVLADAEKASSAVGDLPPLFQAVVKKLGVGGSARIHIPGDQVYGEAGIPGVVTPGAVVVMTIKVLDITSPCASYHAPPGPCPAGRAFGVQACAGAAPGRPPAGPGLAGPPCENASHTSRARNR